MLILLMISNLLQFFSEIFAFLSDIDFLFLFHFKIFPFYPFFATQSRVGFFLCFCIMSKIHSHDDAFSLSSVLSFYLCKKALMGQTSKDFLVQILRQLITHHKRSEELVFESMCGWHLFTLNKISALTKWWHLTHKVSRIEMCILLFPNESQLFKILPNLYIE